MDNKLEHSAKIYMPDKSLDTITLHWSGEYTDSCMHQYTKLHMKIFLTSWTVNNDQEKHFQYYALDYLEMNSSAVEDYEGGLNLDPTTTCLSFDIECRDISLIKIKFNNLPHEISFKP